MKLLKIIIAVGLTIAIATVSAALAGAAAGAEFNAPGARVSAPF